MYGIVIPHVAKHRIYSVGSSKLQVALDKIMPWYMSNMLSINANKSAVMLIGKSCQVQDDVDIKRNDIQIEQVQSMKYLYIYIYTYKYIYIYLCVCVCVRVCIDDRLSWDVQCYKPCSHIAGKISVVCSIGPFCRLNTFELLYEKTIQPIFDYACSVWCHTKQGNISKLQRAQIYAARIVTDSFHYVKFRSVDLLHKFNWA